LESALTADGDDTVIFVRGGGFHCVRNFDGFASLIGVDHVKIAPSGEPSCKLWTEASRHVIDGRHTRWDDAAQRAV